MTTRAVFFPALMGMGILASGALLLADLVRRLMPNQGRRRRYRITVGTYGVIASIARAGGTILAPPGFLTRKHRSRTAYLMTVLAASGGGVLVFVGARALFRDERGLFYESPWVVGLGLVACLAFVVAAAVALALAIVRDPSPRPLTWLVEHSPYGRIAVPEGPPAIEHAKGDRQ